MAIANRTGPHPPSPGKPGTWTTAPREWLSTGARLDDFEIVRTIGSGGFGTVYLARDRTLDREVAIKEFLPMLLAYRAAGLRVAVRSPDLEATYCAGLRSFINEARILARISHPAVVRVHRFWEANGTAYMVMPYVRGPRLRDVRRSMSSAPTEAWLRGVIDPLLDALQALHAEGIYHRDIAPDNILLPHSQSPLLLDFGAARRVIGDRTQALTAVLKPSYAPIEQYAETSTLRQGPWTDLYALGAVVVYLLRGVPPPPSTVRVLHDELPAALKALATDLSRGFVDALQWALAVRPEDRPRSVQELRAAFDGGMTPPQRMAVVVDCDFGRSRDEASADDPGNAHPDNSAALDELAEHDGTASHGVSGGDDIEHPQSQLAYDLQEDQPSYAQPERPTWDTTLRIDDPVISALRGALDAAGSAQPMDGSERHAMHEMSQRARRSARMVAAGAAMAFVVLAGALVMMLRGVPVDVDASIWRELARKAPATDGVRAVQWTRAQTAAAAAPAATSFTMSGASPVAVPMASSVPVPFEPVRAPGTDMAKSALRGDGIVAVVSASPAEHAVAEPARWSSARKGATARSHAKRLAPSSPREACGDHSIFTIGFCVSRKCEEPRYRRHPQCVALQRQRDGNVHVLDRP